MSKPETCQDCKDLVSDVGGRFMGRDCFTYHCNKLGHEIDPLWPECEEEDKE